MSNFTPTVHEYKGGLKIAAEIRKLTAGNEFYSLIEAAMRFADTDNLEILTEAFPNVYRDLLERRKLPGGLHPHER